MAAAADCGGLDAAGASFAGAERRRALRARASRLLGLRLRRSLGGFLVLALLLFLLLLFLRLFLDSGKLAERLGAVFGGTRLAAKLHFEELFENLVELRAARDAERIEFGHGKSQPQRPPFLDVVANLRKGARVRQFDFDERQHFGRHGSEVEVGVLGAFVLRPLSIFTTFCASGTRCGDRFHFRGAKFQVAHGRGGFAGLQTAEDT